MGYLSPPLKIQNKFNYNVKSVVFPGEEDIIYLIYAYPNIN